MEPEPLRIIAFCGPKGSGKDTAAKYLLARDSTIIDDMRTGKRIGDRRPTFVREPFADRLKAACGNIFGLTWAEMNDPALKEVVLTRWPFKSPRELMTDVAKVFRERYGKDVWVQGWRAQIEQSIGCALAPKCHIVTDFRHADAELPVLKELGAKIFYVVNKRVELARMQGIEAGDPLWCDPSEADCELLLNEADELIFNNDNIDVLHTNVHNALVRQLGHWSEW